MRLGIITILDIEPLIQVSGLIATLVLQRRDLADVRNGCWSNGFHLLLVCINIYLWFLLSKISGILHTAVIDVLEFYGDMRAPAPNMVNLGLLRYLRNLVRIIVLLLTIDDFAGN